MSSPVPINIPPAPPASAVVVTVGAATIDQKTIHQEVQYHPAESWEIAAHEATRALVVRQLLLAEATHRGLIDDRAIGDERIEQQAIAELMSLAVPVQPVADEEMRAFYSQNPGRFAGPELFDPSHILLAVTDESENAAALDKAVELIEQLQAKPQAFERLARRWSVCPSAGNGGRLGQVTRGETERGFEEALDSLDEGQLYAHPVQTTHGYHVVRLNHRTQRSVLPFSAVSDKIRIYLRDQQWRLALRRFVDQLAEATQIVGFDLHGSAPVASRTADSDSSSKAGPRRLRVLN